MKTEKFNMRLEVGLPDKIIDESLSRHNIKTINDLYQVATIENVERLLTDLKVAFKTCLSMEEAVKSKTPEKPYNKVTMKHFEWVDDWSEADKKKHADYLTNQ